MNRETPLEITTIASQVEPAKLSDECKHSIRWCLTNLAPLYARFGTTYDSRVSDEIVRLEGSILWKLGQEPKTCADAKTLAANILEQLRPLHDRFGLRQLEAAKPKKPRKVA